MEKLGNQPCASLKITGEIHSQRLNGFLHSDEYSFCYETERQKKNPVVLEESSGIARLAY